mgnify:CR=1 FL=1
MDANGDGILEWGELLHYFTTVGAALTDDEFMLIVSDMNERVETQLGLSTFNIAALVALGSEDVQPPSEDLEAVAPLSAGRQAQLEALWSLLSPSLEKPVRLEVLQSAEKGATIGPHSVAVLKEMYSMDANADGLLSWAELTDYFAAAGAALSDDEFALIVADMNQRIKTQLGI